MIPELRSPEIPSISLLINLIVISRIIYLRVHACIALLRRFGFITKIQIRDREKGFFFSDEKFT